MNNYILFISTNIHFLKKITLKHELGIGICTGFQIYKFKRFPMNYFIQHFMEEWHSFQLLLQCNKNMQKRQIQNKIQIFWSDKAVFCNYWTKKKFKQKTLFISKKRCSSLGMKYVTIFSFSISSNPYQFCSAGA